jgi:hypothetical protein
MMSARNIFTITIAGGILALSALIGQAKEATKEAAKEAKVVVELEDGKFSDCESDDEHEGFTGTGFANFWAAVGATAESTFDVGSAGTYSMTIRYANGSYYTRPLKIMINGKVAVKKQELPGSDDGVWDEYKTLTVANVELKAGGNIIKFVCIDEDGPNLDNVTFVKASKKSKAKPKAKKK